MEQELRLLIIEDVPAEAELAIQQLKWAGLSCTWVRVDTEARLRTELREIRPHLVISDFSLPGYDGSAALNLVRREAPDVPFIFLSGTIGEERAIEALKAGAVDYVLKTNLAQHPQLLLTRPAGIIGTYGERADRCVIDEQRNRGDAIDM